MKNLMIVFFLTLSIQAIASIEVQAATTSKFAKLSFVHESNMSLQNAVKDTSKLLILQESHRKGREISKWCKNCFLGQKEENPQYSI